MKQVWINRAGGPEVLKITEGPDPIPGNGEVRIRVEACGVSFLDLMGRMGMDEKAPRIPYVPGHEVAGRIDFIGQGVPDLREGDNVFAFTRYGGYSNVVCVPHRQVFRRFEWMTPADAVTLPVNYLLAYLMLIVIGSVQADDRVFVQRAAGGVGLAVLDLCRILGAETYGTASPEKHAFLQTHGLDHPIDYRNRDYERVLLDITGGKGVNLVLDPFGGRHWPKSYRLLMPTGRLVYYGVSSPAAGQERAWWRQLRAKIMVPFHTPISLMADNRGVIGVDLRQLWQQGDVRPAWMKQLLAWYDEALFRPKLDKQFRLEEASAAHRYLHERRNLGKVWLQT